MILTYLILAHLLGDFIFQPKKLVIWKMRSKWGTFVHALVHLIINVAILLPFILAGEYWLLYTVTALTFTHFWIDEAKINYDLKHDNKVRPFIIDQLLHLLTILLAYFFMGELTINLPEGQFFKIFSDIRIINLISFLIFSTTVIEIFRFQKEREHNKKALFHFDANSMLNRMIGFTIIYGIFMFLAIYAFSK